MPNIEKHGNGWSYRISQTVNGKRKYRRVGGFMTRESAEDAFRAERTRLSRSPIYTAGYTTAEWLEKWFNEHARLRVAETTLEKYENSLVHIVEELGHIPLSSLKPAQIQAMVAKWSGGRKPSTVHSMFEPLRVALNDAVKLSVISYNPCNAVTLPRKKSAPKQTLTGKQATQLLDAARGKNYYIPILLALMLGIRRSEICGLRWRDIDFDHGFVSIKTARVKKAYGGVVEKDAKSDASTRSIAISPELIKELREHRNTLPDNAEYVCMMNGAPMRPGYITQMTSRLIRRLGLPQMSIHGQRHSHASIMLALGVHPKIVQERLGHSKISTTLDTYSHVLPSMQRESANLISDEILGGPKPAPKIRIKSRRRLKFPRVMPEPETNN